MYSFTQIDLTKAKILFKVLRWLLYSESPCSSIQYPIDIFRISRWRPPPSWIFKLCEFGTYVRVGSVVLALYAEFGSNICYSHWDWRSYAPDVHLMTSGELTSGFDLWSHGHLRMAVVHLPVKFDADIFIQSGVIDILSEIQHGGRRHLGFSGYVNLAIPACW